MLPRTNSTVYSRPISRGGSKEKDLHMRAYNLTNELTRLEYERKLAEMKIVRVERRIDELQKEMHEINSYFKEQCEVVEVDGISQKSKAKHITFEY